MPLDTTEVGNVGAPSTTGNKDLALLKQADKDFSTKDSNQDDSDNNELDVTDPAGDDTDVSDNKEDGQEEGTGDEEEKPEGEEEQSDKESDESDDESELLDDQNVYQALKGVDKDIFKKVPQLRDVIYREQEFSKVFNSVDDAKEAASNTEVLSTLWKSVEAGTVDGAVEVLKSTDKHLDSFATKLLPALKKISPDLYGKVLTNPVKLALKNMYIAGMKSKDKNVAYSAVHAYKHFFDTDDINEQIDFEEKPVAKTKAEEQLEEENKRLKSGRVTEFTNDIAEAVTHSLKGSIRKEVDKVKELATASDYTKKKLIDDIFTQIDNVLGSDNRHITGMNSLRKQAEGAGLTKDWKTRIITAYLVRARQSLSPVIIKVMKDAGITAKEKEKKPVTRFGPSAGGTGGGSNNKTVDKDAVRAALKGGKSLKEVEANILAGKL